MLVSMRLIGEKRMKGRNRTNADNVAACLIQMFINKVEEDKKPINKDSFQVFTDPACKRNRSFGWYAWMEYEDRQEIGAAIDCSISYLEKGFNDNEVLNLILNHYNAWVYYGIKPFGSEEEFLEASEHASTT